VFSRHDLERRYNVHSMREDEWHAHSGRVTACLVRGHLETARSPSILLLNAGAGVYEFPHQRWHEIALDLFIKPIKARRNAVCGSIEALPFSPQAFGAVVCVGEVVAYCDPATVFREFARALAPTGLLILDFRSTRSARYWFRRQYGRAAELATDIYNETPERTWIYDPRYIRRLLDVSGFVVRQVLGTHVWSSVLCAIGLPTSQATRIERTLPAPALLQGFADLVTIVAERATA